MQFQKRRHLTTDFFEQLLVIITASKKEIIDSLPNFLMERIKEENHEDGQKEGQGDSAAAGRQEKGVKDVNDAEVRSCEKHRQDEIEKAAANDGVDVQEVIFEYPEGQHDRRDKAKIAGWIDRESQDRQDIRDQKDDAQSDTAQNILYAILHLVGPGSPHLVK